MLTKDLLRVTRRGGYRPEFVGDGETGRRLAARTIGCYQGHVGEPRRELTAALDDLEREADDFKLVRGFAHLLDREATFETRASLPPERARRVAFTEAETVRVASEAERAAALERAADALGTDPEAVEASLYADRDPEQVLASFDARWTPETLCEQYDLSLAATALFDATEVRVRSSDPKALVSTVKRLGLLYEIREPVADDTSDATPSPDTDGSTPSPDTDGSTPTLSDREVVVTGPDALFRRTRRYGTGFARLLRSVARTAARWELSATIDDRGRERTLELTDAEVPVPGTEPVGEPAFDSGVEAEFAARFRSLDLDWTLVREPEPLAVEGPDGDRRVMIPDFAFDYRYADFRVFFEVMGFWTPSYVEEKLTQLTGVEAVELLVAVDESLGVGEEVAARDHRVVTYDGDVRLKDVVDVLRTYETALRDDAARDVPDELSPDADALPLATLADEYGVPQESLDVASFPDHERVGGTLVRPAVLDDLRTELGPGLSYDEAETLLNERGISDASAVLSRLGLRVEWEGLGGGTLVEE